MYRSTSPGAEGQSIDFDLNPYVYGTAFTDGPLVAGTTYYYKLTAVDVAGESPRSNEASAKAGG